MRSDAPEDVGEGKRFWRNDGDCSKLLRKCNASQGGENYEKADGGKTSALFKNDAQRGADGERAVGGDAVPGDDFGDVARTGAANAPDDAADGNQAFTDPKHEASEEQEQQTDARRANEEGGG